MGANVSNDVSIDTLKNVSTDVSPNVLRDVSVDIPTNVSTEISKDIPKDIPKDISKDVSTNISINVLKDIPKDVLIDISKYMPLNHYGKPVLNIEYVPISIVIDYINIIKDSTKNEEYHRKYLLNLLPNNGTFPSHVFSLYNLQYMVNEHYRELYGNSNLFIM